MANIITVPEHTKQTISIDNLPSKLVAFHYALRESSELILFLAIEQANDLHISIDIDLIEPHAKVFIKGYYYLHHKDSVRVRVNLNHHAEKTQSTCSIKGVLFDQAISNVKGVVEIQEDAVYSNAHFENKVLVFDQAKAISVPTMEVKTNDVHCSHGSAIGRIDEEILFYMASRGVAKKNAISLHIEGFLSDVRIKEK